RHTRWPRDWSSDVCSSDLAGIRLAADAVHGDGERGMGFARDRAERHGAGGESTHDARGGLDLLDRHRLASVLLRGFEPKQAADRSEERRVGKEGSGWWWRV